MKGSIRHAVITLIVLAIGWFQGPGDLDLFYMRDELLGRLITPEILYLVLASFCILQIVSVALLREPVDRMLPWVIALISTSFLRVINGWVAAALAIVAIALLAGTHLKAKRERVPTMPEPQEEG